MAFGEMTSSVAVAAATSKMFLFLSRRLDDDVCNESLLWTCEIAEFVVYRLLHKSITFNY